MQQKHKNYKKGSAKAGNSRFTIDTNQLLQLLVARLVCIRTNYW